MKCIGKITDEDFGLKVIPFDNPRKRIGARGIVFNEDNKIAILNKSLKNEYKLVGGGIKEDEELKLTPKEYDLLVYFINNKNKALSREELLSKIWGYDFFGDDRTIDTHIKMLRNNLGEYRDLIQTVRGMGYKFEIK